MVTKQEHQISLSNFRIQDGFWSYYQNLVKDVVIPYQEQILNDELPDVEKSHAIENFRIAAGESSGEFYGMVFQDSDVAKWLEAVAYSLTLNPDPDLEKRADALIELIGKAQQDDGYLNTYFTVKEPEHRWQNLHDCHELYCAGHMIEAAVAYYEATGKRNLLDIMCRMADHIDRRFGKDKVRGVPGHEEIELALLRLYRATGETRYLRLSQYFIDERGTAPDYFEEEEKNRGWHFWSKDGSNRNYAQNYAPVREQDHATGHSVRAMYLYTAMADLAAEIHDEELWNACLRLFDSTVSRQMYLTGGIGSSVHGEAFTTDYDLPNDTIYAETCAAIGLVFFARRLLEAKPDRRFSDVMERALYNGVLSGMQHDGKRFFYVNPLEVVPGLSGVQPEYAHVIPKRPKWYACACCPPNVSRLLTSLAAYAWGESLSPEHRHDVVYSHLYIGGTFTTSAGGGTVLSVETGYPWNGTVRYTVHPEHDTSAFTLSVRIPGWCRNHCVTLNGVQPDASCMELCDGYLYLTKNWKEGDVLELSLDLPVRRIYANPMVREDAGCVALMRGPLVYCLEQEDNGKHLQTLRIPRDARCSVQETEDPILGSYTAITVDGCRLIPGTDLYGEEPPVSEPAQIHAVPYFLWGNRSEGAMKVWIPEA